MVLKRFISWILSTSVFASLCALALALATERLLLPGRQLLPWSDPLHLLIAGCTLLEYNIHFILNARNHPQIASTSGYWPYWHWILAVLGALLSLISLPGLPVQVFIVLACLGLLALGYSAPYLPFRPKRRINDYGITKILVLTITWVTMTTIIPALYLGLRWQAAGYELLIRMLLLFPLCLAFDLRDLVTDKANGIQTVAAALGARASYRVIHLSLLLLALTGILLWILRLLSVAHMLAVLLAAPAAWGAIRYARKTGHPFAYVGLIDGIMLFYGLLVISG